MREGGRSAPPFSLGGSLTGLVEAYELDTVLSASATAGAAGDHASATTAEDKAENGQHAHELGSHHQSFPLSASPAGRLSHGAELDLVELQRGRLCSVSTQPIGHLGEVAGQVLTVMLGHTSPYTNGAAVS